MTYVDPTYVRPGDDGWDQTLNHQEFGGAGPEFDSFEYGSGGRDIPMNPLADQPGIYEGRLTNEMKGYTNAHGAFTDSVGNESGNDPEN